MDALGVEFQLKFEECAKKLKRFEDRERALSKRLSKIKPVKGEMGADAVLRDLGIKPGGLAQELAAGKSKNGGRRRKTKKRRRKRKTKRKKRKTKKRRRKRKRKTQKKRRR